MRSITMRRPAADASLPAFSPELEHPFPDARWRCLLWRDGDAVRVIVNTAKGSEAYLHAAWHAERPLKERAFECRVGLPCGYVAEGEPRCAPVDGVSPQAGG